MPCAAPRTHHTQQHNTGLPVAACRCRACLSDKHNGGRASGAGRARHTQQTSTHTLPPWGSPRSSLRRKKAKTGLWVASVCCCLGVAPRCLPLFPNGAPPRDKRLRARGQRRRPRRLLCLERGRACPPSKPPPLSLRRARRGCTRRKRPSDQGAGLAKEVLSLWCRGPHCVAAGHTCGRRSRLPCTHTR